MQQYNLIKPKEYVEISNIKPDLNREDLVHKRNNIERIKEFSKHLRSFNKDVILQQRKLPSATEQNDLELSKQKYESKRHKALEFAKNIPKPIVSHTNRESGNSTRLAHTRSAGSDNGNLLYMDEDAVERARIQELENKHEQNKAKIAAIKKSMGM